MAAATVELEQLGTILRGDHEAIRIERSEERHKAPDAVIALGRAEVDAAVGPERDGSLDVEWRLSCQCVATAVRRRHLSALRRSSAGAGDGRDDPVRRHATNAPIALVGDIEHAVAAYCETTGSSYLSIYGRPTIACEAERSSKTDHTRD